MSQANLEVVRRSFDAFNARDVDQLVGLFDSDCEWLPFRAQLEGSGIYRGHEGVRRFVRDMDEDWEAYRIEPLEFHEHGERIAVTGRVRARGRGGSVDIDLLAGFAFEVRSGRVRRLTSHSNPAAALEDVGLAE
jgi:ketosteroid isomerase-like protein